MADSDLTAKKPLYISGDYDDPICPNCKLPVDPIDDNYECSICHQLLDWRGDIGG